LAAGVVLTSFVGTAHAATLQVTTTDDTVAVDGQCSLREAIQAATTDTAVNECAAGAGADTITFAVSGTITLSSELPSIIGSDSVTIDGSGHSITISGNHANRVFSVGNLGNSATGALALTHLTIVDGEAGNGGAVFVIGSLTVTNSTFSGNDAGSNGGAINDFSGAVTVTNSTFTGNTSGFNGGAFFGSSTGSLTVANSTFSGNSTMGTGGGGHGGAIAQSGDATVSNSTFFNNSATVAGGGISLINIHNISVINSTISGNSAPSGGGISNNACCGLGSVSLISTIVANSASGGNCGGTITDGGYNLEDGTSCAFTDANSLSSTNPLLSGLQNNGGPTDTMALQTGSPAIDKIPPSTNGCGTTIATDQRGITRPQGTACDVGAYEVFVAPPACTPTGFYRDGINLTAKQIGGTVTGTLDGTGCNIGAYFDASHPGSVSNANISGANYYGVVDNAASTAVNISNSSIHDIGETQPNGSQHGVGVLYTTRAGATDGSCNACVTSGAHATGTLSGSSITNYQKNGVVIYGTGAAATLKSNTVTGFGMINYIAQNGIEVASSATASITSNTVSGNWYTPTPVVACGLLFFQAGGVKQQGNTLFNNEINLCNAGRGGGNYKP
jgi:CSLREA domain-containing protein